jgi:hypothetical protein
MKVYTNYGKLDIKALESCIIEVESTREWSFISMLFEKELDRLQKFENPSPYECESIQILQQAIKALTPINTLDLSGFNIKKIKTGLHKHLWAGGQP